MSKFKAIFDAQAKEAEPKAIVTEEMVTEQKPAVELTPEVETKRGRPKGKRSHPDYEQVTAYIKKDTHNAIKIALLQEGQKREFSELMQELLDEWLESRS